MASPSLDNYVNNAAAHNYDEQIANQSVNNHVVSKQHSEVKACIEEGGSDKCLSQQ